jgi:hypothetical protein
MKKTQAIELLGGTAAAAAKAIGISSAAVSLWPDELPPRIADRVQAALYRMQSADAGRQPAPKRKLAKAA